MKIENKKKPSAGLSKFKRGRVGWRTIKKKISKEHLIKDLIKYLSMKNNADTLFGKTKGKNGKRKK